MAAGTAPRRTGVRAERAAATRARMLAAARTLFVERGYASTTMQSIATRAGVAVQTLYFTFATKRTILKELLDVEVAGDNLPLTTLERPWVAEAMAAPPADQLRRMAAAAMDIHSRVEPLAEVMRTAAATDAEIAALWQTNIQQRHTVLSAFAAALVSKTPLRAGLDADRAADIALALLAPEVWHLLVEERGWAPADWRDWAADALIRQLLPDR